MKLLQSNSGEIKSEAEWQRECDQFYISLDINVEGKWQRYKKVLGLQLAGIDREYSGRKPTGNFKEGRIKHDNRD